MKKLAPLKDREIIIPSELMDFAKNRCANMLYVTPFTNINQICAEAYLLACNDMVQIQPLLEAK